MDTGTDLRPEDSSENKQNTWFGYMLRILLLSDARHYHIHPLEIIKLIKFISEASVPQVSSEKGNEEAKRKSGNSGGAFLSTERKIQASVFRIYE